LAFFFGLEPFLFVVDLDTFVALVPLVDLDPFVADLDRFVADDLALFIAAGLDPFVLTCCRACWAFIAKNSCLLEHPVFSKIRLMVGEVSSSSMVEKDCVVVASMVAVRGGIGTPAVDVDVRRAFRSF